MLRPGRQVQLQGWRDARGAHRRTAALACTVSQFDIRTLMPSGAPGQEAVVLAAVSRPWDSAAAGTPSAVQVATLLAEQAGKSLWLARSIILAIAVEDEGSGERGSCLQVRWRRRPSPAPSPPPTCLMCAALDHGRRVHRWVPVAALRRPPCRLRGPRRRRRLRAPAAAPPGPGTGLEWRCGHGWPLLGVKPTPARASSASSSPPSHPSASRPSSMAFLHQGRGGRMPNMDLIALLERTANLPLEAHT